MHRIYRWLRNSLILLGVAGLPGLAQAQGERVLRVMGYQSTFVQFRDGWLHTIQEFERQNPGVKVEDVATAFDQTLNQITVAVLGGNPPDVVTVNPIWMPQLNSIGALAPLESYFSADELRQFPPHVLQDVSFDGKVRGLVLNPGPIMMIYNRDLMRQAGLDPDQAPRTWPELTAAIRKICALPAGPGGKLYGIALRTERQPIAAQWTIPVIWGQGGDIADKDGNITLATPAAVAAFQWYHDLVRAGCAPENATVADTRNLFALGRAGFVFEGPWIHGLVDALSGHRLHVAADGDIWAAPMPADPSGKSRQFANHGVLAIIQQSKNKDLAAKFIRFATGDRAVVEYSFATSGVLATSRMDLMTTGSEGADPFSQLFVKVLDQSIALPLKNPRWAAAMDPVAVALQTVIEGADPLAALTEAQREAQRIMSRR
jgi:multiple sugar transport system substrate-binding protein